MRLLMPNRQDLTPDGYCIMRPCKDQNLLPSRHSPFAPRSHCHCEFRTRQSCTLIADPLRDFELLTEGSLIGQVRLV
jgi:hypothetical protein